MKAECLQYCTFYLNDDLYGVEAIKVQEITRYRESAPVPLAPPSVKGLINLRGQIVTAIDLRKRLDLPEEETVARPMNIIIQNGDEIVSLLVDKIGDVLEIDRGAFEAAPENSYSANHELIEGVYKMSQRVMLLLNLSKVLDPDHKRKNNNKLKTN